MSFASDTLTDTEMRALLTRIAEATEKMAATLERMEKRPRGAVPTAYVEATDAELDDKYGDPEIKKDPPKWTGRQVAPCYMSEGTPEWLDCLASFYDWQAEHSKPYNGRSAEQIAGYKRKDAARARGWARRLRAGWKRPGVPDPDPNNGHETAGDSDPGDGGW